MWAVVEKVERVREIEITIGFLQSARGRSSQVKVELDFVFGLYITHRDFAASQPTYTTHYKATTPTHTHDPNPRYSHPRTCSL